MTGAPSAPDDLPEAPVLLTATPVGLGGTPAVTTLLLAVVVLVSTAAVVDLLVQHRADLVREPGGAPGGSRRARGRVRSLVSAALVAVCALGLGTLLLTGATPTSRPLLVGLVGGVVACAAAAAAVVALVHLLRRHEPPARPVPVARPAAPRTLAAVPPPGVGTSPQRTARGVPADRESVPTRADRREERERGRGRQRREAVTAVETVLGRGAGAAPPRTADPSSTPSRGALAAREGVFERQVPGGR